MSLLVRKIQRSKWGDCATDLALPVNADALTNCLKATHDTLSVWFACDENDLENAKIALIGTMNKVEKIDIVILNQDELRDDQIELVESPGETVAKGLIGRHRDLAHLSVVEMGKVAKMVQGKLANKKSERINKPELISLFKIALEKKLISLSDLSEEIQAVLAKK